MQVEIGRGFTILINPMSSYHVLLILRNIVIIEKYQVLADSTRSWILLMVAKSLFRSPTTSAQKSRRTVPQGRTWHRRTFFANQFTFKEITRSDGESFLEEGRHEMINPDADSLGIRSGVRRCDRHRNGLNSSQPPSKSQRRPSDRALAGGGQLFRFSSSGSRSCPMTPRMPRGGQRVTDQINIRPPFNQVDGDKCRHHLAMGLVTRGGCSVWWKACSGIDQPTACSK